MKSTVKRFGDLHYRNDGWREITCERGFLLCVDEHGNGEPSFNLDTMEGRKAFDLWQRLNGKL